MRNNPEGKVYMKYPNCFISKGYLRSTVTDTQRKRYLFIPNETVPILEKKTFEYKELSKMYGTDIDYIVTNDIIFPINPQFSDLFPAFNTIYDSPSFIENSIIDIENLNLVDFMFFVKQLDILICKSLQIRIFKIISKDTFHKLMNVIDQSSIESVEIVIPYSDWLSQDTIQSFISNNYNKITVFFVFSAKKNDSIFYNGTRLFFSKGLCKPFDSCGNINSRLFTVNVQYSTLSQCYNTCLYKKISIDTNGNIKNCPSCSQSYGNIEDTTLEQAMSYPDFKKYWNITKDQIDVCKDCEFRHMCTDCRVFIKDSENIFSQPSKCTYNPYIAKWQGEEGYVPVEECGTYTRETGFIVNHKRIEKLNSLIWKE
ncbi:MAG: grasp-with-spasm system SPASM domain peptide maturase [Bacilli bacterium]|jgi:SPASM domain peptide maturase of grasp-with-spasm system